MSLIITLCARGGSKGIPGKNIKPIAGQPLIAYSINTARRFAEANGGHIALSTDDPSIKEVAKQCGLVTEYLRPAHLATDTAGKIEVIKGLLEYEEKQLGKKFDYILDLDITSPLRTVQDLEEAFKIFQADSNALNLFSVNVAGRNPYFNMVEKQDNGYYGLVKKGNFLTRQSAPAVYELNASFYFYRRSFFEGPVKPTINEHSMIYPMPHICFDLDELHDFEFMAYLLETKKLGFPI